MGPASRAGRRWSIRNECLVRVNEEAATSSEIASAQKRTHAGRSSRSNARPFSKNFGPRLRLQAPLDEGCRHLRHGRPPQFAGFAAGGGAAVTAGGGGAALTAGGGGAGRATAGGGRITAGGGGAGLAIAGGGGAGLLIAGGGGGGPGQAGGAGGTKRGG